MKTKADFNFNDFIGKVRRFFLGFDFEEGGNPHDSEDPPYVAISSDFGFCCVYDPAYDPPCQKEGCIVVLVFNDQQKNLSLSGLVVLPISGFNDPNVIEPLKYLLVAKINPKKEIAHIKKLFTRLAIIERYSKHDDPFSVSVTLKQDKCILERKELESYLQQKPDA